MFVLDRNWRKPTRSGPFSDNCVEARLTGEMVEVRSSNTPEAGVVCFTTGEWRTFLDAVRENDEFELPA